MNTLERSTEAQEAQRTPAHEVCAGVLPFLKTPFDKAQLQILAIAADALVSLRDEVKDGFDYLNKRMYALEEEVNNSSLTTAQIRDGVTDAAMDIVHGKGTSDRTHSVLTVTYPKASENEKAKAQFLRGGLAWQLQDALDDECSKVRVLVDLFAEALSKSLTAALQKPLPAPAKQSRERDRGAGGLAQRPSPRQPRLVGSEILKTASHPPNSERKPP